MKKKIPKIIHYCWFGGNKKSKIIESCINSWKEMCPDYEIVEWNEDNFDINCNYYVKEAYEQKKWAFVTDYVRLKVLYEHGGVYLDTDVELIKSLDDLLKFDAFYSCEDAKYIATGLGIGSISNNNIIKAMMNDYENIHFKKDNGDYDLLACPIRNTNTFRKITGITDDFNKCIIFDNSIVLPKEYFCPLDYETGKLVITDKTYAIHHYAGSWLSKKEQNKILLRKKLSKVFGLYISRKIVNLIYLPDEIKENGFKTFIKNKIKKRSDIK